MITSKIKLSTAKIVGSRTEEQWSQIFVFEEEETIQKIDILFGVLTVKNINEEDPGVLGKNILAEIEEKISKIKSLKRLEALKDIISSVKNDYCQEIAAGLLWKNTLYLVAIGPCKIIIKRDDKIVKLLEASDNNIKSSSGFIRDNDILIIETSGFAKIINEENLKETVNNHSIEEISDILAPQILNSEENSKAAAIFINFKKETIEETEEESQPLKDTREDIEKNKIINLSLIKLKDKINIFFHDLKNKITRQKKAESLNNSSKATLRTVAIFLLLLLGTSIFLNINKQIKVKEKTKVTSTLEIASSKYEEGKSLVDLNPIRSKVLLKEAEKAVQDTKVSLKKGSDEDKKLQDLLEKIQIALSLAIKIYKVSPQIFYDLTIIKDKGEGSKISLFQKDVLALDIKNNSIYKVGLENKSGEIITGGEKIKGVNLVSLYGKNAYLLNPQKGIIKIDLESKSNPEYIIEKDNSWGEIIDFFSYGGNLYLLDKKNNQIWKFIATDTGFSNINNYLNSDTTPDFGKIVSFAIDGSIWILRSDGEVLKFTQGRIDNFTVSGLDIAFKNPSKIYTDDGLKNLYILDKGNKRVVVIEKNGKYYSQYQGDFIGNVQDIVVSEELKKIFLLESSKIYSIDLK